MIECYKQILMNRVDYNLDYLKPAILDIHCKVLTMIKHSYVIEGHYTANCFINCYLTIC